MTLIRDLFSSKKFVTSLVAALVVVLGKFGFEVEESALLTVISPFMAYVVGQGIADASKERAKVELKERKEQ